MIVLKVQFCPRCDKPFRAASKVSAWGKVLNHIKKAHPDYVPMIQD